ncbi:MAG TPA: glycosyltransferase [Plantibacter sp.]|uniref:glycosyltransferase n=1 Tax=unclassified Plantibacter TaxID=2624265 RepID=UPI002B79C915|nr:glycosyltransferase [Plantibacter sp.]
MGFSLFRRRRSLPDGRHFAVTWGLADEFGGMTEAMLQRSRAFVRLEGRPVDVVTFDHRPDYPTLESRLHARGDLVDGIRIVNLWDWLRSRPLPGGSVDLERHVFTPLEPHEGAVERRRDDAVLSRERHDSDGQILQVDVYRVDGSLLLSDRRDAREHGTRGGRSVVLCDENGHPVRSWGRIWSLYRAWFDALTAGDDAWMIVDSKTIAPFVLSYRKRKVVTAHVVHASHLQGTERPHGRLRESRRAVFEALDEFDLVAVLSDRQRDDIIAMLGEHASLHVIPNSRNLVPSDVARADRPRERGLFLGSLTSRKRPAHAVRGVLAASTAALRPTLDVYGGGEQFDELQQLIAAEDPDQRITLHGYDRAAREQLGSGSFLVMTSTSEGFPLVLIEAMAAGCLPIVVDVPYGPADLVRDGWNGFLVASAEPSVIADAIERLLALPDDEVARMRRHARSTAEQYDDDAVTRRWAHELRSAARRKTQRALAARAG